MSMELQIISPKPGQRFPDIRWNNEELKQEIAKAMTDYQNLVVTEDSERDCRDTRAKLNKLRTALEDARKEMKKRVNEPYVQFEKQVKEVEQPIDLAIGNLDSQLQELVDKRKEQKRKDIEVIWDGIRKPKYLTIDRVWNEKWLNATYAMKQIVEDMNAICKKVDDDINLLGHLQQNSFEALQFYAQTLDAQESIKRANELAEITRKKADLSGVSTSNPPIPQKEVEKPVEGKINVVEKVIEAGKVYTFRFDVTVTAQQARMLGDFCRANNIKLTQVK